MWVHFNGGGVTGKVQVCRDKRVARGKESGAHGDSFFNGERKGSWEKCPAPARVGIRNPGGFWEL